MTGELQKLDGEKGFVEGFEQYDAIIKREDKLKLHWSEFVETLVKPQPGSQESIRNTFEVSRHLNYANIIFPNVSARLFHSAPNLLTGVGILGTFVGLASGVGLAGSGLSSSNPSEITDSLQQL